MTDFDLLHEYAARKSEASFTTLVNRYVNLVYSAALRQTHNPHTAEEIAQAVFIILARKAGGMRPETVLSGWLLRTTRFVALNTRRRELHRLHTEQETMNLYPTTETHSAWEQIAPLLDEALVSLSERDRNALTLRFFEHQSFKEIGGTLGTTEDGAQKRVSRALEKLRGNFAKHGLVLPSALLVGVLSEGAVQAAPSTLAASAATAAMSSALAAGPVSLLAQLAQAALETAQIKARAFQAAAVTLTVLTALLVVHQLKATSVASPAVAKVAAAESERRPMNRVSAALPRTVSTSTQTHIGELLLRVLDSENETPIANARLTLVQTADFPNRLTNVLATGQRGECLVPIDRTPAQNWNSRIEIYRDGYVPKYVSWSAAQGDAIQDIPAEYTTKLIRGVNIGGMVANAKGEAISDAKVVFTVSGPSPGASLTRERLTMMGFYHAEVTDGQGRWHCNHVPSEFGMIDYVVSHPDYITGWFVMAKLGPTTNSGSIYLAEEALRNGTATMILKPGLVVAGAVVDEGGQPVVSAKVTCRNGHEPLANQAVGLNGRFRFSNASDKESILTVQAEGFAPRDMTIQPAHLTNELLVVLTKGAVLRGQVVDESGAPIAKAGIAMSADELNRNRFDWSAKTDEQGRFEWLTAPASQAYYAVSASGYKSQSRLPMIADGTEHLITLRQSIEAGPVRFSGTVVDAETRQPVQSFKVLMSTTESTTHDVGGFSYPSQQTIRRTTTAMMHRTNGKEGRFSFTTSGAAAAYVLEIEADGYWPARIIVTEPLANDCQFAVELKRGAGVNGIVQWPDGTPVSGATVVLCTEQEKAIPDLSKSIIQRAYMKLPGQLDLTRGSLRTESDIQGRFSFPPKLGIKRIIASHTGGYGETSLEDLAASRSLVLQPWGRVAGTLMIGNQPGRNESIALDNWFWRYVDSAYVQVNLATKTDADGRFVIEGVPPGDWKVSHRLNLKDKMGASIPLSQSRYIEVKAGQTTQVTVGGTGRTVVGRIKVSGLTQQVDWLRGVHRLSSKVPNPVDRDFCLSEAGREAQRRSREYALMVDAEGAFKIDDVLPGIYDLRISMNAPNPPDDLRFRTSFIRTIQKTIGEIIVPDAPAGEATVCDLGALEFSLDKP